MTTPKPLFSIRIFIPFCIGIGILRLTGITELNSVIQIYLILHFILLFIINYLYRSFKFYHHKGILALGLYLGLFLLGAGYALGKNELSYLQHFSKNKPEFLLIVVAEEPRQSGDLLRFKTTVVCAYRGGKMLKSSGSLLLSIRQKAGCISTPTYGQTYIIPARFSPVPPPYNPGEFDYRAWLGNRNMYHQGIIESSEIISTGEQNGNAVIRFALALRKRQTAVYRKLIKSDEAFAVAATLILGYRADLDAETLAAYSKTGTIHALSVSGMHVGIIYAVLEFALRWMNRKTVLKWLKVVLILTLIWWYTLLTGYSASVLRSAIMLTLFITAKALHKETGSFQVLTVSAFCLLLYDPFLLWDAGFQLSYLAVAGLVGLQPGIEKLVSFKWKWVQRLWGMIALSVAAQVLTAPFSIYYFHQFPVYFILSNLFIALPVTVLMYAGITILLFRLYWLAPAFEWLICRMNAGLKWMAELPYAVIDAIWLSKGEFLLLLTALLCFLAGIRQHKKPLVWLSLLLLLALELLLTNDKITCSRQQKILLFTLSKDYAAAFITGRTAVVLTNLKEKDKAFRFHIRPGLDQMKITTINCIPWGRNFSSGSLIIANHQLHFGNFRVLLADTVLNKKSISTTGKFNALWVHLSPQIPINIAFKDIRIDQIWVDGTNKPYAVKNFIADAVKLKRKPVVLIKNNSSLINLK
jgi:competence protein ComEC